jgi:hypothetical protein
MNYQSKTRIRLAGGAAIVALSATGALAQQGVEQVVVSSTRLQSAGFDAPTPTTVVSSADLQAAAQPNVFDAITQLPALQGSTGVGYNTLPGCRPSACAACLPCAPWSFSTASVSSAATSMARLTSAKCRRC